MMRAGTYGCGKCQEPWSTIEKAKECCNATHLLCPLEDLPENAFIGHGLEYGYGKAFTGDWEIVYNHGTPADPVMVYPLPGLVCAMIEEISQNHLEEGGVAAQKRICESLGLGALFNAGR
ncbi:hypothetical protein [Pseudomonas putida]|uniref:Uncharacterized protein n=1 Tax=Pseudomonas putida TaxID=303 RepID=A0A8I1JJQ1_PSEPU|nr:hypothetical protein [Pseudomonas putida]MBI6882625.1 hypothetical protein [Pseudomonas putida]